MEKPKRTMQQLAQEAYDVQDASNMSGVVHSFSRAITELRQLLEEQPGGFSNTTLHTHPIVRLWIDKLASLACIGTSADLAGDYKAIRDLIAGHEVTL